MDNKRAPAPPQAVLFDAYGTLFDVYSVGLLAEQLFPGHGERLALLWRDLLDPVLSVHGVRRFKTDPAAYALGPEAFGLPAKDILFVSSNGWDAIGATWFGYTTLWVNRASLPLEQLDIEPTRTGSSLRDVLSFFPD